MSALSLKHLAPDVARSNKLQEGERGMHERCIGYSVMNVQGEKAKNDYSMAKKKERKKEGERNKLPLECTLRSFGFAFHSLSFSLCVSCRWMMMMSGRGRRRRRAHLMHVQSASQVSKVTMPQDREREAKRRAEYRDWIHLRWYFVLPRCLFTSQ